MEKKRPPILLIVRRIHLFLALFLTPWVLMYALSTIAMHHRVLFTGHEQRVHPGFTLLEEQNYPRQFASDADHWAVAGEILGDLDMEGAYSVRGNLDEGRLVITRDKPIRPYQITYTINEGSLLIERQNFGMSFFLEMLHRRRGFQQSFFANDLWAVVVDGVILAILLWAATGLWMWWSMIRTRKPGAWCLVAGAALFTLFLLML